jgi:hypothetical protein
MSQDKPNRAIICDLDGTLALLNGRDPYDASACESDVLNKPIAEIIASYRAETILVSGRFEKNRPQTLKWLKANNIPYYALYRRKDGDMRKDTVIKKEIYEAYIKNKFTIDFCIDDRPQVVRMWRHDLGMLVLQLNDKEF